ncbi:ABC transporter A family member 8 [Striga asiatica]|uniref:ABC transporter A family member 8 n=1 Tax=Striga asiatica TaxID=4170 RepID=A0A5A7QP94_STRAF|nr:ABC transporter A family member 8 [Striga asiatica]
MNGIRANIILRVCFRLETGRSGRINGSRKSIHLRVCCRLETGRGSGRVNGSRTSINLPLRGRLGVGIGGGYGIGCGGGGFPLGLSFEQGKAGFGAGSGSASSLVLAPRLLSNRGNSGGRINEIVAAYDFMNSNENLLNVTVWYTSTYKNDTDNLPIALTRVPW